MLLWAFVLLSACCSAWSQQEWSCLCPRVHPGVLLRSSHVVSSSMGLRCLNWYSTWCRLNIACTFCFYFRKWARPSLVPELSFRLGACYLLFMPSFLLTRRVPFSVRWIVRSAARTAFKYTPLSISASRSPISHSRFCADRIILSLPEVASFCLLCASTLHRSAHTLAHSCVL